MLWYTYGIYAAPSIIKSFMDDIKIEGNLSPDERDKRIKEWGACPYRFDVENDSYIIGCGPYLPPYKLFDSLCARYPKEAIMFEIDSSLRHIGFNKSGHFEFMNSFDLMDD